ncbi:MAG: hypothetical protein ACI9MR_002247 [Myxococcota bacterium]|jgi:hypothetical protein
MDRFIPILAMSALSIGCSSDGAGEFQGTVPTLASPSGPVCQQTIDHFRVAVDC